MKKIVIGLLSILMVQAFADTASTDSLDSGNLNLGNLNFSGTGGLDMASLNKLTASLNINLSDLVNIPNISNIAKIPNFPKIAKNAKKC